MQSRQITMTRWQGPRRRDPSPLLKTWNGLRWLGFSKSSGGWEHHCKSSVWRYFHCESIDWLSGNPTWCITGNTIQVGLEYNFQEIRSKFFLIPNSDDNHNLPWMASSNLCLFPSWIKAGQVSSFCHQYHLSSLLSNCHHNIFPQIGSMDQRKLWQSNYPKMLGTLCFDCLASPDHR